MGVIWYAGAAVWGVAEATLFFVVPDVFLTFAVMRLDFARAFRLALVAATAASLAGLGMWLWARNDAATARHIVLLVPAIGPDLLAQAHRGLETSWAFHLVKGAMTGVPYKLYAFEAGARGLNPILFALASFVARLTRFVLTALLAAAGRRILALAGREQWRWALWAVAWILVYGFYFHARGLI